MEDFIDGVLRQFESGRLSRRQVVRRLLVGSAALASGVAAAPPVRAAGALTLVSVDHISYRVADYARTRDFYADLFECRITDDTGTQCQLRFGDSAITARNPRQANGQVPLVDHVAYRIADWQSETVKEALERRGLKPRLDLGDASSPPNYVSFHVLDPDGYDVQISGVASPGDPHYR